MPDPGVTTDDGAPAVITPAFAPGIVIAGRYRLESRLGAGGGGTVWRAFDEKLGARVAFKIVSADVDVERWRREVAMARRIADRHVCRVHDLGETPDVRFVTMELVEGTNLRAKLRPDMPADEARALFRQIVSGAAAIHAAGVVHRDLKPENIVVEPGGRAVIVDFGLAREPRTTDAAVTASLRARPDPSATVTSAGVVVGTPRYMSPEQAAGDTVDARSDVWALGLIGHELLTGELPPLDAAGGRRVGELAKWPAAGAVIARCLALRPAERHANAGGLAAALATRARNWRGIVAIAGGAAVAATLALVGIRTFVSTDAEAPPPPPPRAEPRTDVRATLLTNTDPKQWPLVSPVSVAIAPDATRFAYTTAGGELHVRALAGGAAAVWPVPRVPRASGDKTDALVTVMAVGWYRDGSIALQGTTRASEWRLYRVHADGNHTLLYRASQRFPAAVASTGDTLIAKHGQALFSVLANEQTRPIATVGNGEQILALAYSPDATRIASARAPADARDDVTIHVTAASGETSALVWRGTSAAAGAELLTWLDDDRLAFGASDPASGQTRIYTHDLRSGKTTARTAPSDDYFGLATTARGITLVLRGTAHLGVQVGDKDGWPLQRLHDASTRGDLVAGWTSDHRVVFAHGEPGSERVVRASLAHGLEPWPNTTAGVEVPDAVVGDAVITHRHDRVRREIVIERIDASGEHSPLVRLPAMALTNFVRCAGDRLPPCVLEQLDDDHVTWTELDPITGKLGKLLHRRPLRARYTRSAALSVDGKTMAIVEGTDEVHLVTTADGSVRTHRVDDAEALQSVAFDAEGNLWTSSVGFHGRLYGLARYGRSSSGKLFDSATRYVSDRRAVQRWFWRPTASPDLAQLAVVVREFHLEVARLEGL